MKKTGAVLFLIIWMFQMMAMTVLAKPEWPADISLLGEGGVVMDMDSGAVLYGKNLRTPYPPASITKILTALIVIENSHMDDMVTFSDDAVNNVESGSSNARISVGDELSVEDCLYAMLLKSANEAANALAEHVAGSRDGFVEMMNDRIARMGCTDSHFANPSGLNSTEQYVTPYDMALIACEAFKNQELVKIASTKKYKLPSTKLDPNGQTIEIEHKMLLDTEHHYDAAVAGKTGYTKIAGNTLVTLAEQDGRRLTAVVLKDKMPNHYVDTIALFQFGFEKFRNYNISENTKIMGDTGRTVAVGGESYSLGDLSLDENSVVTLPMEAAFSDAQEELVTQLPNDHPDRAAAMLKYTYNDRVIGSAYLYAPEPAPASQSEADRDPEAETVPAKPEKTAGKGGGKVILLAAGAAAVIGGGAAGYLAYSKKRERELREERRRRRRERLKEIGYSEEEFKRLVDERGDNTGRKRRKR